MEQNIVKRNYERRVISHALVLAMVEACTLCVCTSTQFPNSKMDMNISLKRTCAHENSIQKFHFNLSLENT